MKKVIVVDDDLDIRELLTQYLENHRFDVTALPDGEQLLAEVKCNPRVADLIILDVMLPGADGFDICRKLRSFSTTPVIMLTANSDEMDRIVGLELGADDYLAKPFNPRELLARIKAVFRRTDLAPSVEEEEGGRYIQFAGFELDTSSRKLFDPQQREVECTGADYDLLLLFLNHPGEVLSRDFIASKTRGRDNAPMDRFVDVHVSRLRQRLRDDAKSSSVIKTVRGQGYVIACPVESAVDSGLAS